MINKDQKLVENVCTHDVEQGAIRAGFGEGLLEAGKKDERIVGLCADLTDSTKMNSFAKEFPKRFIEVGVAEQNLASVASGMAAMGKVPFISSYAMFSPGRNWEQIRTTICYNDVPVKIAGSHAGISVGPDGGTHQAIEDIAITRVIPNMVVISPCDIHEARKATIACAETKEPTYLRLAREATPIMTTEETPFEIGKASELFKSEGKEIQVGMVAVGALVHKALCVAKKLDKEGVGIIVLNMATIKPLDKDAILALSKEVTKGLVSIEEHQIACGMGSAISEFLAENNPTKQKFIGVHDKFGQSGTPEELIKEYKIGEEDIEVAARELVA